MGCLYQIECVQGLTDGAKYLNIHFNLKWLLEIEFLHDMGTLFSKVTDIEKHFLNNKM